MLAGEVGWQRALIGSKVPSQFEHLRYAHSHIFTATYQTEWLQLFQVDTGEEEQL